MPKSSEVFVLSPEYIIYLHDYSVGVVWPGVEPVGPGEYINRPMLESAAWRPFQTALGTDVYGTILKKAAALFHSLVANHPFQNGNKRTAVLATHSFLLANEHLLFLTPDEMRQLAESAASYRQKNQSHDDILRVIETQLGASLISFELLKNEEALEDIYQNALDAFGTIRAHPSNARAG